MDKKTLFIGWGDVVKLYYWKHLQDYFYSGAVIPIIAEIATKASLAPGLFKIWGSPELDKMIIDDEFERIFILSPPEYHMSQLMHCLDLLAGLDSRCAIYLEKPVDIERELVRACIKRITELPNTASHPIYHIDHYTQKRVVKWLHDNSKKILQEIGPVKEIYFTSYEIIPMANSAAFTRGYAREHGIHAWAMIAYCLPDILIDNDDFDIETETPLTWKHYDCPDVCAGESAFLITYHIRRADDNKFDLVDNNLKITLAAGKALAEEVKKLMFIGEKGKLVAHFNEGKFKEGRIFIIKPDGIIEEPAIAEVDYPKQFPYKTIIDGIFDRRKNAKDVTIGLQNGLNALERIEIAARKFGAPKTHEQRKTPVELQEIQNIFPNTDICPSREMR